MKKILLAFFLIGVLAGCDRQTPKESEQPTTSHSMQGDEVIGPDSLVSFGRAAVNEPNFWDLNYRSYKVLPYYVEVSYSLYVKWNKDTNLVKANVRKFYDNCSGILGPITGLKYRVDEIYIWTTPDPYEAGTSSISILYAWSPTAVNRKPMFRHFMNNKNLGGAAYVNGGLVTSAKYGVITLGGWNPSSNIANYSYGEYCIMHESLHTLGLRHSQSDCAWLTQTGERIGPLDHCGQCENSSACPPSAGCTTSTFGSDGGIMSYCHIYGRMKWKLEAPILAVLHKAIYYASPTLTDYIPTTPPPTPTNTFSIAGTPYTGYTRVDTAKAVDGNETTRFLTTGATTLTWNFSQPTTRTQVYLSSGFVSGSTIGSPNQTLTLTVDGVPVDLAFDKKVKFTKVINATGKRFVLTTTGTGNISRIFEVSLK